MAGCPVIISDQTPWKELQSKGVGWDVNAKNKKNLKSVFEKAVQMSNEDYQIYSIQAKQFSKDFSENPELLMLNLALFK